MNSSDRMSYGHGKRENLADESGIRRALDAGKYSAAFAAGLVI